MRLARVYHHGEACFALQPVGATDWAVLSPTDGGQGSLGDLIGGVKDLDQLTERARARVADPELLCPVFRPSKILAIGLNYLDHIRETGAERPERPVVFAKYPNSLNGPFDDVVFGHVTEQADYEAELAVVIGQLTKSVTAEEALDHVFGYAIANDVSARDWQRRDAQFSRSKSADTFCPIGPWITSADDVASPATLAISSKVNDEVRQSSSTAQMLFGVPELIAFLSTTITLEPGDVILTGTPPGVGLGFEPPRFLADGDTVECTIEGLGTIRNRYVAGDCST